MPGSKAGVMFVEIGSAYENASYTSGVISYDPWFSKVITACGIPPSRCVGGICETFGGGGGGLKSAMGG